MMYKLKVERRTFIPSDGREILHDQDFDNKSKAIALSVARTYISHVMEQLDFVNINVGSYIIEIVLTKDNQVHFHCEITICDL